jgi:hypothetical protein
VTTFLPLPLVGDLELGPAPASPQPSMTLTGQVNLQSHEDFPQVHPSLFEDTRIAAFVVVDVVFDIEGGVQATVRQASGTGTYVAGADLTGCGRPPETKTGNVVGGFLAFEHVSDEPELDLRFSGTRTSTTCDGSTTSSFLGSLPDGELKGTAVLSNGFLVAMNFNRTTTSGNRTTITTGVLTP